MRPQAAAMKVLLSKPALQVMPGCYDAVGAHLIAEAGFPVGFASGSSITAARLAMPDMGMLSIVEMRDAVAEITAAAPSVLWLADGDTGYGNEIAVQRTVREYARAGAAAILIEDKAWPQPLAASAGKTVVDREAARLRLRAAVHAAHDEGVLLLARTDARLTLGLEEALARLRLFAEVGADLLYLDSPQTEAEMRAFVEICGDKPAVAVTSLSARYYMPDNDGLTRCGVRLVIHPQNILAASIHAARRVLAGLRGGENPPMATGEELASAVRKAEYLATAARLTKRD
ncbi:MAG TPA: isocitrate lyase/PEP mutase family protein [Bauldia sp.]|nr:isocitrate lyase/PEP mutase family protein [Bauldia sp.]